MCRCVCACRYVCAGVCDLKRREGLGTKSTSAFCVTEKGRVFRLESTCACVRERECRLSVFFVNRWNSIN